MRAAFASVLQSCDELPYSDAVTRFGIAEASIAITSRLHSIYSFRTGHLSRNISLVFCDLHRCRLQSVSFVDMFPRTYRSGESMSFRRGCLHQQLQTPLQWLWCKYFDGMSLFLEYYLSGNAIDISQDTPHGTAIHWQHDLRSSVSLFSSFRSCISNALVLSSSVTQSFLNA